MLKRSNIRFAGMTAASVCRARNRLIGWSPVRWLLLALMWNCVWVAGAQVIITNVIPAPDTTLGALTQITVFFNEPVYGVDAGDLIVNGQPASTVTGPAGTNCYTFAFTQPLPGQVGISWDDYPGISDLSGNEFDPGAPWTYLLVDNVAPQVSQLTPVAGARVSRLTQVEVIFNEPVAGVEASDLLVNGQPANQLTIFAPDRYLFQFPQPPAGAVPFAWAAGHGIQDLATTPNPFAGGSWTNVLDPTFTLPKVRLNEFLTANFNTNGLTDQFGELEDWIELYNYGTNSVDLAGYSLTDDPDYPGKWVFPSVTLGAGQYLVVFASGRDLTAVGGTNQLHTSFSLGSAGEYLGLFNAESPRTVLTEFAPEYPPQRTDYSYGYDPTNALKYFSAPTPGADNGSSTITGAVAEVHFTVERGFFNQPFTLLLNTATPGATIRYTTNGTPPTETTGMVYSNSLVVDRLTTLRALACKTNLLPTVVQTHTYIFLTNVLNQPTNPPGFPINVWNLSGQTSDYGMDPRVVTNVLHSNTITGDLLSLPALSIVLRTEDMFGGSGIRGIYTNTAANVTYEVPCSVELINPDGSAGVQIDCGIRQHGGSSRNNPMKKPFGLKFRGKYGDTKLHYQLFPDTPVDKFNSLVLRPDYNNSWTHSLYADQRARGTLVRDAFFKDVQGAMGDFSSHSRYVHLYINGLYWGVYNPSEDPDDDFAASYFGGDNTQYDAFKGSGSSLSVDGDLVAHNAMLALNNSGLVNLAQYEQIKQYLDVTQYADYMILQLYGANQDWGTRNNWAAIRKRETNATFKYLCWDSERILEGSNDNRIGISPDNMQGNLILNAEYRLLFADRVHKHLFNDGVLTPTRVAELWKARASQIDRAIVGESARWGDASYGGKPAMNPLPYPGYTVGFPYTREENWLGEQGRLLTNYFPFRTAIALAQFRAAGFYPTLDASEFNRHSGRVPMGFGLTITSAVSTIYYTTNGSDPRVYGAGTVSDSAAIYSGAFTLTTNVVVKARVLNGGTWSALTEATFTVSGLGLPLRITEIMYNPAGGGGGADAYEFLEVQNVGALPLNIGGFSFQGINFIFPDGTVIQPGAVLLLANSANPSAFATRYPSAVVFGYYTGNLSNGGERIALLDRDGQTVIAVHYDDEDGWLTAPDGGGYSLEIIDPRGDPNAPANWRASTAINGTPGLPPVAPVPSDVVINELMADNATAVTNGGAFPDWAELYNRGTNSVNLTKWSLTDNSNARQYVFPTNTMLAAGGYLVVWCDTNTSAPGLHTGFALGKSGETLSLFNATTNRVDALTFGLQLTDYSVGRVADEWRLTVPTPNAVNVAAALASPTNMAINEWLADPATGGQDWLELFNRSSNAPVALCGLYLGTSNNLCQIHSLSFVRPRGYVQLFAEELSGADQLEFKLPAAGGAIALYDEAGIELERVIYGPQLTAVSQGRLPDGAAAIATFTGSVSPGASNYVLAYNGPVLNEVLARNQSAVVSPWGNHADFVELFNPGGSAASLAGMALGKSTAAGDCWTFPAGASLPAAGYLVVWCDSSHAASTTSGGPLNTGFSLPGEGGDVYLFNTAIQPVDVVSYGFQVQDASIGSIGGNWRLLAVPTPGSANSAAATLGTANGLRLNEWMADPLTGDDWFELYNSTALPVALGGLFLSDNPSITGITNSQIAPLSFIGAGGWVQFVADNNPAGGRDHVGFALDKEGETLRLYDTNLVLIDAVDFGFQTEGVSEGRFPDGGTNIVSFVTTPSPGAANYLPLINVVINEAPQNRTVFSGERIEFGVVAEGAAPLNYQWFFNDEPLANQMGTNLVLASVQMTNAGSYRVQVTNTVSVALSDSAVLTVLVPPSGRAELVGNSTVRLSFAILPGRSYQLEYLNSLEDPEWTPLGLPVTAGESTLIVDDDIGSHTQRFYRLVVVLP
jgi:hypothetical protein